jgi:hypothetical protein
MARCDEGYLCDVCGGAVDAITESDLYLRYVLGEVKLERLHTEHERHIRCNAALAQFIADAAFEAVVCAGAFSKSELDPEYTAEETVRVTAGWRRLQALPTLGLPVALYPLEVPS